jgi:hypothetical protein
MAGIKKTRGKKNRTMTQKKPTLTSQDAIATAFSPRDGCQHSTGQIMTFTRDDPQIAVASSPPQMVPFMIWVIHPQYGPASY